MQINFCLQKLQHMSFSSLGLSSSLQKAIANENYLRPYPIQKIVIPLILKGRDVFGIAKTGSGKTAAYVLPILQNQDGNKTTKNRHISVLVLVPTRELAIQVGDVFKVFEGDLSQPIKSMAVYGGVSINPQMIGMQGIEILVATPGRLLELLDSKAVHLSKIKTLVLDEADKILNLGFKEEMSQILELLPKKRQNLLFSATLNAEIDGISQLLLKNPEIVKIHQEEESIDLVDQVGYFVNEEKKGPLLRYLIKKNNLKQVLVFTSSTFKADIVAAKLRKNGIDGKAIHGKKSQSARTKALEDFKKGKLRVLVTTDLLARGIDIEFLPCVINYELPRSPKDYIHRIGRTGRAESTGEAITFVSSEDIHHFEVIQKKMKKVIKMVESENIDLSGF